LQRSIGLGGSMKKNERSGCNIVIDLPIIKSQPPYNDTDWKQRDCMEPIYLTDTEIEHIETQDNVL
jgi:hypothetical protein